MTSIIECRFCREVYHAAPEEIGARCKSCRMPLFERPPRRRPGYDLGPCAVHAEIEAYGKCRSCGKLMCHLCRTRWYDQLVCPGCLTAMLEGSEANPRDVKLQNRSAAWSVALGLGAWLMLVCAIIPFNVMYTSREAPTLRLFAAALFFGSMIPAAFAIGQATSVIRLRSERLKVAVGSLFIASSAIGLVIGVLTLNLWFG